MQKSPTISVIMPNYNYSEYIQDSIESILNQSFSDFELIIVDDASTDNSRQEIERYLGDGRIILISLKENCGNYKARNIGLEKSRGNYIAVMDADDIAHIDRLSIQYRFLKNTDKLACLGSQGYYMDTYGNIIGNLNKPTDPDVFKVLLLKNNYSLHPSLFYKKSLLKQYNLLKYDEKFSIAADYDFITKCAYYFAILNLPERLISYRVHSQQISSRKSEQQKITARCVRHLQLIRLGLAPNQKELHSYHHLMEGIMISPEELPFLVRFLNRIVRKNNTHKLYDADVLFNFFQDLVAGAQLVG